MFYYQLEAKLQASVDTENEMKTAEYNLGDVLHTLSIVQHSTFKLGQTDGRPYGELFTLASTLRKSCSCGNVNDMLPLTELLEAELLVCSFLEEVKYSFNKL